MNGGFHLHKIGALNSGATVNFDSSISVLPAYPALIQVLHGGGTIVHQSLFIICLCREFFSQPIFSFYYAIDLQILFL
jgi:hypothetical protein